MTTKGKRETYLIDDPYQVFDTLDDFERLLSDNLQRMLLE